MLQGNTLASPSYDSSCVTRVDIGVHLLSLYQLQLLRSSSVSGTDQCALSLCVYVLQNCSFLVASLVCSSLRVTPTGGVRPRAPLLLLSLSPSLSVTFLMNTEVLLRNEAFGIPVCPRHLLIRWGAASSCPPPRRDPGLCLGCALEESFYPRWRVSAWLRSSGTAIPREAILVTRNFYVLPVERLRNELL